MAYKRKAPAKPVVAPAAAPQRQPRDVWPNQGSDIAGTMQALALAELRKPAPDEARVVRLLGSAETLREWGDGVDPDVDRLAELREYAKAVCEEVTLMDARPTIDKAIEDIERRDESEPIDGYVSYATHREIVRVLCGEAEAQDAFRRRLQTLMDDYRIGDEY